MPSWGQAIYPLWWPSLTKDCTQNSSVLEWYDRHRQNGHMREENLVLHLFWNYDCWDWNGTVF